ncbi:uncharacterized protein LOC125194183 [Salvia hispanica]|uniref:uncharacterized protein LOC125194183 n=1 Tax=Salvia hispanica TaxID=49212 RepID=UPI002009C4C6|nr:uncharacterized protein LOC125194183 [Salvia hispanica]
MASPPAAAAPFQPVYLHQLYRDPAPEPLPLVRREMLFFCRTLKWCVLGFIFLASFLVLMWIIFHPTFPLLNVSSASMSPVAFNASAASADCNITFILTNPNHHLTASYDQMEISLLYASQQVPLSIFHQPPIVQPKRGQTTLQANLSFSGVDLGGGMVNLMKQDVDRGSLGLTVKIFSVIKFRNGKWKTKSRYMRAYCPGVSFGFVSSNKSGIFLNPYQECQVYLYSK